MSRVTYSEWDSPEAQWAGIRWAGAAKQAFRSKRGQAALRELEAALLALPQKRLIEGYYYKDGEVCALGALALQRGLKPLKDFPATTDGNWPPEEAAWWAEGHLGLTYTLAWEVMAANDDDWRPDTPEARYERMLAWVRKHIAGEGA